MSHVIRVDAEVFAALQRLARPLLDTPNDVLRRVLDLDNGDKDMQTGQKRPRSDSGRINRRYHLKAKHPLYHVDGKFFERLERFPGFLADAGGYVWYATEAEFLNDALLSIGEKVNIRGKLSAHPRYKAFPRGR
jgi:hypothetical protein